MNQQFPFTSNFRDELIKRLRDRISELKSELDNANRTPDKLRAMLEETILLQQQADTLAGHFYVYLGVDTTHGYRVFLEQDLATEWVEKDRANRNWHCLEPTIEV